MRSTCDSSVVSLNGFGSTSVSRSARGSMSSAENPLETLTGRWHRHVEQDEVGADVAEPGEGLGRGVDGGGAVAGGLEDEDLDVAQVRLVVDHEDLFGHGARRWCKANAQSRPREGSHH
jgi:hypothetical protein